ncbi:MAG TPA: SDR family NAD(P)-dependent oxidoreductase [Thermoanaerobaculia bacterium]|nr:SDR family NAD(P)-dependent oxidoreductase [Thermoanaerobaculia bacterium]
MEDLQGRVGLVVGASAGIGRSAAEHLIAAGVRVGAMARSAAPLAELESRHPGRALALPGDATDPKSVDEAFARLERELGPVELLVCCAGLVDPRPLVETTDEQWDRSIRATLHSAFFPVRRALPSMLERRRGSIVCVASISGVHGSSKLPGLVPYCAGKSAVIGFVEAIAAEVGPSGVRVNAVSPGSVDTPMLRAAAPGAVPAMSADEVASSILFLLSDRSRPIQGQNLHVYSV